MVCLSFRLAKYHCYSALLRPQGGEQMSAQTHRRWLQARAVGATVILTPFYVGNSADAANLFDDPFFFRGERFAPLTLIAGQGLSAAVSNVLIPKQAGAQTACPVEVRFFAADASLIAAQSLQLLT